MQPPDPNAASQGAASNPLEWKSLLGTYVFQIRVLPEGAESVPKSCFAFVVVVRSAQYTCQLDYYMVD